LQLYTDNLDSAKHNRHKNAEKARNSLDQDVNGIGIEERLKRHVGKDEEIDKSRCMSSRTFKVRVQRSELWRGRYGCMQAGIRCLVRRVGEMLLSQTLSHYETIYGRGRKMKKGRKK